MLARPLSNDRLVDAADLDKQRREYEEALQEHREAKIAFDTALSHQTNPKVLKAFEIVKMKIEWLHSFPDPADEHYTMLNGERCTPELREKITALNNSAKVLNGTMPIKDYHDYAENLKNSDLPSLVKDRKIFRGRRIAGAAMVAAGILLGVLAGLCIAGTLGLGIMPAIAYSVVGAVLITGGIRLFKNAPPPLPENMLAAEKELAAARVIAPRG